MKHYCPGGVHWHIGFFELIIWRLSGISHLANENGSGDYFHLFVTRLSSIFFTGDCYFDEFETYVRKFLFGLNFAIKTVKMFAWITFHKSIVFYHSEPPNGALKCRLGWIFVKLQIFTLAS